MNRRAAGRRALLALMALAAGGCVTTGCWRDKTPPGMQYRMQELTTPRPNRVHVLRVDLSNPAIYPAAILADDPDGDGPAEATLTSPLKLASRAPVLAFINANPWRALPDAKGNQDTGWHDGQAVDILGLAASAGRERSAPRSGGASVWVGPQGRLAFGDVAAGVRPGEGIGGFQKIVEQGAVVAPEGNAVHPRTAVGADRSGKVAWLVVVDGRQPGYSEGMTLRELAGIMRGLGCWTATNLDGGGSTIMGIVGTEGQMRIVNGPSDRRMGSAHIRPVPIILTIQRRPSGRK
jgi:hypothetical protein